MRKPTCAKLLKASSSALTTEIKRHDARLRARLLTDFGAEVCGWMFKVEREMLSYVEASFARGIGEFRIHLFPKGSLTPPSKILKERAECAQTLLRRKYGIFSRVVECENTEELLFAIKIKIKLR